MSTVKSQVETKGNLIPIGQAYHLRTKYTAGEKYHIGLLVNVRFL